jgi:hypothetical protein
MSKNKPRKCLESASVALNHEVGLARPRELVNLLAVQNLEVCPKKTVSE